MAGIARFHSYCLGEQARSTTTPSRAATRRSGRSRSGSAGRSPSLRGDALSRSEVLRRLPLGRAASPAATSASAQARDIATTRSCQRSSGRLAAPGADSSRRGRRQAVERRYVFKLGPRRRSSASVRASRTRPKPRPIQGFPAAEQRHARCGRDRAGHSSRGRCRSAMGRLRQRPCRSIAKAKHR